LQLINESDNQVELSHEEEPTLRTTDEDVHPEFKPLQKITLLPVEGKFCLEKYDSIEELYAKDCVLLPCCNPAET
jgi:hypothetical protein